MTPAELKTAIEADAQALALAQAGNDNACAARMTAVLPPVVSDRIITDWDVPDAIMTALETGATTRPGVQRIINRLGNGGINIGDTRARNRCDQLVTAGVLTNGQRNALKDLALLPQVITAAMVSAAMLPSRPNGRIN